MSDIKFSRDEKQAITNKIQKYFESELNQDIGQFDAEFLLDFFAKEIGIYFYNKGLYDVQNIIELRVENIRDDIYQIEKPV